MRNQKVIKGLAFFAPAFLLSERVVEAAFNFNVQQVGASVIVTGSGTLNISGLGNPDSSASNAEINPFFGMLFAGPAALESYNGYAGISGPSQLGPGEQDIPATTGSGDIVGVYDGGGLVLPSNYVSGSPLSDTDTYFEDTIAQLGLTPGVYNYTWGSGPTADSLTINIGVVPEPASAAAVALPATLALLRRRRRRSL